MDPLVLHRNPRYKSRCIKLLNSEWPRSEYARSLSLDKCNDDFPVSLLLVRRQDDKLIGHGRLCLIPGFDGWCLVESVVVAKDERRKGYGRMLMDALEQYARKLAFHTAYLTTHNQKEFYKSCGYEPCSPLVTAGSSCKLLKESGFSRLLAQCQPQETIDHRAGNDQTTSKRGERVLDAINSSRNGSEADGACRPSLAIPPPHPPPPPPLKRMSDIVFFSNATVSMKKRLCS